MTRNLARNVKVVAALNVAASASLIAGCFGLPGLGGLFGAIAVVAANSGESTVDKVQTLTATVTGNSGAVTFQWSLVSGPPITINNNTAATANATPTAAGIYTFQVVATDGGSGASATAQVTVPVADIQFLLPQAPQAQVANIPIAGNPATLVLNNVRSGTQGADLRCLIFDPEYTDDENTVMTVTYDIVSIPAAARAQDIELDRDFDTISNQGRSDNNDNNDNNPDLDTVVGVTFRPNPGIAFKTLTNLGTVVDNFGYFVPGQYVFRATLTSPNGLQRTRDLTLNVVVENLTIASGTGFGATADSGSAVSPGPAALRTKTLPTAGGQQVTNRILTTSQSSSVTVTALPSSTTTYRFFLRDNAAGTGNAIAGLVTPASITLNSTGEAQDINLTVGPNLPVGTYTLVVETFNDLGTFNNFGVVVNSTNRPITFHVTQDFLAAQLINSATVGVTTVDPDAEVDYQGWSGNPSGNYGGLTALADVNLDGVLDVISLNISGSTVFANVLGFVEGSTAALRHPDNSQNFVATLANPASLFNTVGGEAVRRIATGDLNGDGLADIATSSTTGAVRVYFHTGNPLIPYSNADEHVLQIFAPVYDYEYFDVQTNQFATTASPFAGLTAPALGGANLPTTRFGEQIAIGDVSGDNVNDLVVTFPRYSTLLAHTANGAIPATTPAAIDAFYFGSEGRVFVFNGGGSGNLAPTRPDIITVKVSQTGRFDSAAAVGSRVSVTAAVESDPKYSSAFLGNRFDEVGWSLAVAGGKFAVGSPRATGAVAANTNRPVFLLQFPETTAGAQWQVADTETIVINVGGQTRTYEFDTNAAFTAGNVQVAVNASELASTTALQRLVTAINADGSRLVDAVLLDPALFGNLTVQLTAIAAFNNTDFVARAGGYSVATAGIGEARSVRLNGNDISALTDVFRLARDGVVYRQNGAALTGETRGTAASDMGFGATLAKGSINATNTGDDLVVGALDSGAAAGRNDGADFDNVDGFGADAFDNGDDGAVFVLLDGATTIPAKTTPGFDSLGKQIGNQNPTLIPQTAVGRHVAVASNGNVYYSEPGFGRIYLHQSSAFGASPNNTFAGVVPSDATNFADGAFVFGDITGDTFGDWLFFDDSIVFGFAGIER